MALVVADRVQETTTTTGQGTVTLAGAAAGYQSFAVIGDGNTTYYTLTSGNNWEVGVGTYTASGTTLARTTVLASSAGGTTKITLSGTSNAFVAYPAEIATMLTNPVATNGGVVYGTGTAINVSAAGTVNGYQFLQSAGAASPTWVQINSFKDVATAPTSPTPIEGDRFFDNTTGIDYTYITDVDGSQWVETAPGNLASVAGGSSTQVQYNNAGILGGITGATTNGTVLTLTTPVLGAATGTSLALGGATLGSNALAVTGTTQLNSALIYGGITLSNAVTGTGNMVLSASPTLTGAPSLTVNQDASTNFSVINTNAGVNAYASLILTSNSGSAQIGQASTAWSTTGIPAGATFFYTASAAGLVFQAASGPLIFEANGTTEKMRLNSTGLGIGMTPARTLDVTGTFGVTGTASIFGGAYISNLGGANKIINGDMVIDQRNAGASALVGVASPQYFVDRFGYQGSVTSKLTAGQNYGGVTPPDGFVYYLGAKVTTAYATGAGDYFSLQQKIEGLNCTDLNWGTANAKAVTLSFYVYSSVTGTFGGVFQNSAGNRSYPFTYTISVASTWELKTINVAGDTSGTWLTTSGIGMEIAWGLGVGSTYSGTAGAWAAANYISATGATNIINTLNATFYVTGVKLEVGSIATPFVPDDYEVSLGKCLRYFYRWNGTASNECVAIATNVYNAGTGDNRFAFPFPVPMRAIPTLATTGTFQLLYSSYSSLSATIAGTDNSTVTTLSGTASGLVGGNVPSSVRSTSTSSLQLSAEL